MQPLHHKYDPPIAKIKTIRSNNEEGGLENSNGDIDSGGKWVHKTFRELLGSSPPTHEIIYGENINDMPCKKIKQINKDYISAYCAPPDLLDDISKQFSNKFSEVPVVKGIYDWSDRKDFAYGSVLSLYEKDKISNVQTGEPLADALAIVTRQNCSILVLADGVSWGRKSKLSSNCAVHGATIYLCEHIDSCTTTKDVFSSILHAFKKAQQEIVDMEATLTTLCVGVVVQLQEKNRWAFCVVNVGDSYAYFYNEKIGVKEVTYGSHSLDEERDMRFSGGSLGPADGCNPDLANLTCSFVIIEKDDIVFLCSDGISDNYDPAIAMFNPRFKLLQNNEVNENKVIVNNKSNPGKCIPAEYTNCNSSLCLPFSTKPDGTEFVKEVYGVNEEPCISLKPSITSNEDEPAKKSQTTFLSSTQAYHPTENIEIQQKSFNTYVKNTPSSLHTCDTLFSTENVAEIPNSEFLDQPLALKSCQNIRRKNEPMSKSLNLRIPSVLQEITEGELCKRIYDDKNQNLFYTKYTSRLRSRSEGCNDTLQKNNNKNKNCIKNNLDDKCAECCSAHLSSLTGESSIRETEKVVSKNLFSPGSIGNDFESKSQRNKHSKKENSSLILEKDEYISEPTGTPVLQAVENKVQNGSKLINNVSPKVCPNTLIKTCTSFNQFKNPKQPHDLAGDSMSENVEIEMKNFNNSSQINDIEKEDNISLEKSENIQHVLVSKSIENTTQNGSELINNDSPNISPNMISLTPRDRHEGMLERMTEVIVGTCSDEVPIDGLGLRAIDVCVRIIMFVLKRTEEKRQVLEQVPLSELNLLSPKEKKEKYATMKKDLEAISPPKMKYLNRRSSENKLSKFEMVNYLAQIGGRNIGDTTRKLLRTLFSKGLSLQLNFAGRNGKVGIGEMKITSLIVSVVKKNKLLSDVTASSVEQPVKVWLRQSCDREGGRNDPERGSKRSLQKIESEKISSYNLY